MVRTKVTGYIVQAACMDISQEPSQADEIQQQVQLLELEQSELECAFLEESFFIRKGVILQFLNNNCTGATSLIGAIRLALEDIRKIPAYLDKNASRLKYFAVKCLDRHIRANLCATGAGENLTHDDYGISFSLASVSQRGLLLNPSKRNEGQLFYCLYPGLHDPVFLGTNPDGTEDFAHIINVFIHLTPSAQRRNVVLMKLERDSPSPALSPAYHTAPIPIPTSAPGSKRAKGPHGNANGKRHHHNNNNNSNNPLHDTSEIFQQRMESIEKELQNVRGMQLPNPPLPVVIAPPVWRRDGAPTLPEGL